MKYTMKKCVLTKYPKYSTIYSAHLPKSVIYLGCFKKQLSSHVHCPCLDTLFLPFCGSFLPRHCCTPIYRLFFFTQISALLFQLLRQNQTTGGCHLIYAFCTSKCYITIYVQDQQFDVGIKKAKLCRSHQRLFLTFPACF